MQLIFSLFILNAFYQVSEKIFCQIKLSIIKESLFKAINWVPTKIFITRTNSFMGICKDP